jgi:hypothetical protein
MPRRRILIAALVAAFVLSGGALAAGPAASLPAGWSHAEVNVTGPRGHAHTLIFDRGRVQSVASSSLTLKERDGSVVTIQVAPRAVVRVNGRRGSLDQILPGYTATTQGVDGRPANLVRAFQPTRGG